MNYYQAQFACLLLFALLCAVEGFISIKIESPLESIRKYLQDRHLRRLEKGREPLEQKRRMLQNEHRELGNEQLKTEVMEKRLDFFERLESSGRSMEAVLPATQTPGSPDGPDLSRQALSPAAGRRSLASIPRTEHSVEPCA
jgi:hypothetical protein